MAVMGGVRGHLASRLPVMGGTDRRVARMIVSRVFGRFVIVSRVFGRFVIVMRVPARHLINSF
jgi:hypothetical protein